MLEDHQSLKRAHAQALVDLLDLKQQTNLSLLDNRPKIDVCVETDKENSLVVDENVFIQKKIGTATPPRQNEIDKSCQYLRSLSRNIDESSMSQHPSLQKVFSETSPPNLALRMSDQRVLQRADASDVPTQHRPSLRSQSLHNETQVNMFNHQSQSMRSTFSGSGGNIDLRATPINHDLNAYQNEAAQTPLSSVQQKIALFDKNREPSSGPSLPRPGHSISDSQARTSQNKSNTHSSQAPRDSPSELSSLIFTPLRSEQEIPVQTNSGRQAVIPPVTGESKISQIMKPGKKDDDSKLTGATSTSKPSKPVVQTRSSSRNNRRLIETHKIT